MRRTFAVQSLRREPVERLIGTEIAATGLRYSEPSAPQACTQKSGGREPRGWIGSSDDDHAATAF